MSQPCVIQVLEAQNVTAFGIHGEIWSFVYFASPSFSYTMVNGEEKTDGLITLNVTDRFQFMVVWSFVYLTSPSFSHTMVNEEEEKTEWLIN